MTDTEQSPLLNPTIFELVTLHRFFEARTTLTFTEYPLPNDKPEAAAALMFEIDAPRRRVGDPTILTEIVFTIALPFLGITLILTLQRPRLRLINLDFETLQINFEPEETVPEAFAQVGMSNLDAVAIDMVRPC